MTKESDEEDRADGDGDPGDKRRLLRSVPRPIVAAVVGVFFFIVCAMLPENFQHACVAVGKIIPAACGL